MRPRLLVRHYLESIILHRPPEELVVHQILHRIIINRLLKHIDWISNTGLVVGKSRLRIHLLYFKYLVFAFICIDGNPLILLLVLQHIKYCLSIITRGNEITTWLRAFRYVAQEIIKSCSRFEEIM